MKLGIPLLTGGVSATGIAVAGSYYVFSSRITTIKEELKEKKFIPENDSDQGTEEFKSDKENIKKLIPELKDAIETDGGSKLKEWCKKQMELDARKNPTPLKLVGEYCLIRDLASQLSRKGKTLLTSNSLSEDGTNTYSRRKTQTTSRTEVGLDGQWVSDSGDQAKVDLEKLQKGCSDVSKEDFLASDQGVKYEKLHKGCTKEGKLVD